MPLGLLIFQAMEEKPSPLKSPKHGAMRDKAALQPPMINPFWSDKVQEMSK
jgi:hypothetical protein